MIKWTEWFDSPKARRKYIKAKRKDVKAHGNKLCVLKVSYCRQRCTGKKMYFADLFIK